MDLLRGLLRAGASECTILEPDGKGTLSRDFLSAVPSNSHSSHFPARAETQSTLPNWDGRLISYFWKSSNNFLKSERSRLAKHLREEIWWSVAEGAVVWLHSVRREWKSKNSIQYTLNLQANRGRRRDKRKGGKWKTNLIVDCVTISHSTFGQHLEFSSNINHPGHPISSSHFLFCCPSWTTMAICLPRITACHAQGGWWADRKTRSKTWITWLNFTAKKNITVAERRKKGRHLNGSIQGWWESGWAVGQDGLRWRVEAGWTGPWRKQCDKTL